MIVAIKQSIEQNPKLERGVSLFIQALIFLSLVAFSIDTLPNLEPQTKLALKTFEHVTMAIFTVEYLVRLLIAPRKLKFVFSFFGLVDLITILPFYLALGMDLRSLRAFRLLSLVRIFKLARYNAALRHFHTAFNIAKEELALFLAASVIILYLAGVGIYHFEYAAQPEAFSSVFHSLWWAVATLTTVGYGDIYPITAGGKIFTFFILIIGLGVVAIPAGMVASALSKARELEASDKEQP
ncbi:voltage-gated potassium channel [Vibrio xiamenensis]|uniref:Voltage-gated potassium channel n=1 Tax=Vibrio xiamenensis TaxID=861298 RepID=A0A1G8DLT3_9VIBR|nr:voltage-gated potassium channel [Vibrio xiamenensis]